MRHHKNDLLEKLLKERDDLLAQRPELIPLQKEIDRILAHAGTDPEKRAEAAFSLLAEHLKNEFYPALKELYTLSEIINKKGKKS